MTYIRKRSSLWLMSMLATASLAAPWAMPAMAQTATAPATPGDSAESIEHRDARMGWWRQARFGMFIHWGVYSVPAGTWQGKQVKGIGEWIMNRGKIPVADYAKFAEQFNPTKFDASQWVQTAKDAGMKYMVITSKHHDGFAMFHSKVDNYNISDATPFKRDPLAELSAACQQQGMKLGFYYSQAQDWHHPGGAANGGHWDKAQDGDFDQYLLNIALPQVKEILGNYGPVSVLWFDTPTNMTPARADLFTPIIAQHPDLIVNNRLGGGFKGDTETPEQHIPPQGYPGRDWETCMTINDTWGYKSYDVHFKSTETLLRNLIDIASKGGNYLLNVGPDATGVIPQPEVDRLLQIGQWLKLNGDAIYGTNGTAFGPEAGDFSATEKDQKGQPAFVPKWEWRCTTKALAPGKNQPDTLFIHLFKWPGEAFQLAGVKGTVKQCSMLADPQRTALKFSQEGDKLSVSLPPAAPDPIASVLKIELQ